MITFKAFAKTISNIYTQQRHNIFLRRTVMAYVSVQVRVKRLYTNLYSLTKFSYNTGTPEKDMLNTKK